MGRYHLGHGPIDFLGNADRLRVRHRFDLLKLLS